jgi:hypothetical protein
MTERAGELQSSSRPTTALGIRNKVEFAPRAAVQADEVALAMAGPAGSAAPAPASPAEEAAEARRRAAAPFAAARASMVLGGPGGSGSAAPGLRSLREMVKAGQTQRRAALMSGVASGAAAESASSGSREDADAASPAVRNPLADAMRGSK